MAGNIKDLIVRIMVDDADVEKFQKAGTKALDFGNVLDKAALGAAAALAGLAAAGGVAVQSLARIETINAQTEAAIASTGGAANVSAEHVEALAGALETLTGTEGEAIQEGANLLLTFKNIKNEAGEGNDIFDQSVVALTDLSRAMGTDPQSAAIQLGKALNDPVAGIAALSRVGITFTEDQENMIRSLTESGNAMEAQKIILAELESQFGGSGEAYAGTVAGQMDLLGHKFGETSEKITGALMPAIEDILAIGADFANWASENSELVRGLVTGIGALSVGVLVASGAFKAFALVQGIAGVLSGIRAAQAAATAATTAGTVATTANTAATWANNVAWLASPVTWIIIAIIAAIGLLVAAGIWLYENWDEVTKWLGEAWENVAAWFQSVGDGIAAWWNDLWTGIAQWVVDTFGPMIQFVMERFEMFQLGLRIIGDAIAKWWNDLWSGIGSFFGTIWDGLQDIVRGAWNGIVGWIESGVNNAINLINGIIRGINNVGGAVGIHLNLIPNVNIPRLATGGITLGPQLAVVGDNRSGREAVVPLDDPRSAAMLRDAMGGSNAIDQATLDRTVEKLIRGLGNEIKRQLRDGGVVFP